MQAAFALLRWYMLSLVLHANTYPYFQMMTFTTLIDRYVSHPMWMATKEEAKEALPIPPDLVTEFPVCRWRSSDYVPPEK